MKVQKPYSVLVVLVLISLLLSACGAPVNPSADGELTGTIAISGAFALYPIMTRWAEEFQKIHPNVQFDISAGGAGKGMTDAISGAVDIGMVSREIKPEEEAQGAFGIAVTKDAVFPVINANNPVAAEILAQGISPETFVKIYISGEITTWGEVVGKPEIQDKIHIYTRSDACGAAEMWAKFTGNKKQEDLLGIGVNGDPGVLDAVIRDPLGIGYNNLGYAFELSSGMPLKGAVIVPIDLDGDGVASDDERIESMSEAITAVATGKYPSPPARPLYVVTKGKPSGLTQAFITWILTDGQSFVGEAGYVQLSAEKLSESLERVK
jgi:phosphate transport system substrate-binding protein